MLLAPHGPTFNGGKGREGRTAAKDAVATMVAGVGVREVTGSGSGRKRKRRRDTARRKRSALTLRKESEGLGERKQRREQGKSLKT